MGCGSCASGACGSNTPAKEGSKTSSCGTGGCNKMNSFDWLGNMELPGRPSYDIVEVKFKGGRKEFYRNTENIELNVGDPVVIDAQNGHHIGYVCLMGELVRLQMLKKSVRDDQSIRGIYRIATAKDLEKFDKVKVREMPALFRTRQIVDELNLKMKLSDVEFQADNTKATFHYSAEGRVDFRDLIKLLAGEFKVRVEMRQINLRQEAGRIGGIGSCGRELCCSTWLTDFKGVSTGAARYQNLSLNSSKLSGQCGRLKCCLNYELETYLDALIDIPNIEKPIKTDKGLAALQKVDIFKKILWFSINGETTWYPVEAEVAKEYLELSQKGQVVTFTAYKEAIVVTKEAIDNNDFTNDSELFVATHDRNRAQQGSSKSSKKKKKRSQKPKPNGQPSQPQQQQTPKQPQPQQPSQQQTPKQPQPQQPSQQQAPKQPQPQNPQKNQPPRNPNKK